MREASRGGDPRNAFRSSKVGIGGAELERAYHALKIVPSATLAHLLLIFSSTAREGWNDGHCWLNANLANQVTLGFPVVVIDGIICSLGIVGPRF